MTRYMMIFLFFGVLCMTLYGLAAAEAPVSVLLDDGFAVSGPVETGTVPETAKGASDDSLSLDSRGPRVSYDGKLYHYNVDTP